MWLLLLWQLSAPDIGPLVERVQSRDGCRILALTAERIHPDTTRITGTLWEFETGMIAKAGTVPLYFDFRYVREGAAWHALPFSRRPARTHACYVDQEWQRLN